MANNKLVDGKIVPLTAEEQAEHDAKNTPEAIAAKEEAIRERRLDGLFVIDPTLRAFALVLLDEINLLRAEHGLRERTPTQLRNAVKARMGA